MRTMNPCQKPFFFKTSSYSKILCLFIIKILWNDFSSWALSLLVLSIRAKDMTYVYRICNLIFRAWSFTFICKQLEWNCIGFSMGMIIRLMNMKHIKINDNKHATERDVHFQDWTVLLKKGLIVRNNRNFPEDDVSGIPSGIAYHYQTLLWIRFFFRTSTTR